MKLITIVNARAALQKLSVQDLPIRSAWEVVKLIDECNVHLMFYGQQMQKKPDREHLQELNEMEISGFDARVKIRVPLAEDLRLSAADIKALEPFVEFEEV